MRHLTDEGLALIKRFEGFASETYICPGGWPTIGYGHVVRDGEQVRFANGIDEATAEELLRRDVESAERAVPRLIRVPLEDGQFDALCSFTFNLGAGALQRAGATAKNESRGARRGAGRVPALGLGWRAQVERSGAAAGGGG